MYNVRTDKMAIKTKPQKTERIYLRASSRQKRLFQRVARKKGETASDFILESAEKNAREFISAERDFVLSRTQWNKFTAALDQPPKTIPALQKLLSEPSVLE